MRIVYKANGTKVVKKKPTKRLNPYNPLALPKERYIKLSDTFNQWNGC